MQSHRPGAEAETRPHVVRTIVRHAARKVAAGEQARTGVAMTKTLAAAVVQDATDDCVQVCGGNDIGKDLPLADFT